MPGDVHITPARRLLTSCVVLLALSSGGSWARTPERLPLVQSEHLVYLGSFTLPIDDGVAGSTAHSLAYGGHALGMGAGGSLYVGCHRWHTRLARVSVPAPGERAEVLMPCTEVADVAAVDPGAGEGIVLGGALLWNDRLLVSAYSFYDADGNAKASHVVAAADLSSAAGPFHVGVPGLVGGFMGVVPEPWRARLGGPALTGLCCVPIISRTSAGPSVSVFDPDHVGGDPATPARMLVGYPDGHALAEWSGESAVYNGATEIRGLAFPAGTRSLLFIGRHGDTFCYGTGASCNDPVEPHAGTHAFPYRHQVWAYDANHLVDVREGRLAPWDVRPYAVWTLDGMSVDGDASIRGAVYDETTRRLFVTTDYGDNPRVHVYQLRAAL